MQKIAALLKTLVSIRIRFYHNFDIYSGKGLSTDKFTRFNYRNHEITLRYTDNKHYVSSVVIEWINNHPGCKGY